MCSMRVMFKVRPKEIRDGLKECQEGGSACAVCPIAQAIHNTLRKNTAFQTVRVGGETATVEYLAPTSIYSDACSLQQTDIELPKKAQLFIQRFDAWRNASATKRRLRGLKCPPPFSFGLRDLPLALHP